jgi:hypothetical protein
MIFDLILDVMNGFQAKVGSIVPLGRGYFPHNPMHSLSSRHPGQGLPWLPLKTCLALTRRYTVAPSRKTPGSPGLEVLKGLQGWEMRMVWTAGDNPRRTVTVPSGPIRLGT